MYTHIFLCTGTVPIVVIFLFYYCCCCHSFTRSSTLMNSLFNFHMVRFFFRQQRKKRTHTHTVYIQLRARRERNDLCSQSEPVKSAQSKTMVALFLIFCSFFSLDSHFSVNCALIHLHNDVMSMSMISAICMVFAVLFRICWHSILMSAH